MTDKDKPDSGINQSIDPSVKSPKIAANTNTDKKDPKTTEKKHSWSRRLLFILVIFIAGTITAVYFMPILMDRLPFIGNWVGESNNSDNLVVLNQRITQQQQQIDQLTQKSLELEIELKNVSVTDLNGPLSEIEQRLTALEQKAGASSERAGSNEPPRQDTSQSARIDMLLSRMSQLEASFVPLSKSMIDGAKAQQERASLKDDTIALSDKVTILERKLINLEQVTSKDNSVLLLAFKINELKRKLNSGLSYKEELSIVKNLVSQSRISANGRINNAILYLSQNAETSLKTPDQIKRDFNNLIPALIRTKGMVENAGWWQTTLNQIKNMITVRRTANADMLPDGTDGMIVDIEKKLYDNDFQAVIGLFNSLPSTMRELLKGWLNDVEKWVNIQTALSDLETVAIDSLLADPSKDLETVFGAPL